MATSEPESIERLLERLSPHWDQAGISRSCRLLRLSILREMSRGIHTLRSECMATDRPADAEDLSRREHFLNARFTQLPVESLSLRQAYEMEASFSERPSGQGTSSGPGSGLPLPPELLAQLPAAKLTRQDRKWESELAVEACRQGWSFWIFEASVEVHDVESFARIFSENLWPRGIVLFVESDGFLKMVERKSAPTASNGGRTPQAYWRGRWTLVLESHVRSAEDLGLDLTRWPEADPQWTKLYPAQAGPSETR